MPDMTAIRWSKDASGVVLLTLDDPAHSANTMNSDYRASMQIALDRIERELDSIVGIVITSAKRTFFAGGDLGMFVGATRESAPELTADVNALKGQLRRLETLGRPVAAAINGSALGGGLEIALACHRRFVADVQRCEIGLPEVTLGLLPGGGGVVRTVRMLGLSSALADVLLEGQRHTPSRAHSLGLVDEVVAPDELVDRASAWVRANPDAHVQPWDRPNFTPPGGDMTDPAVVASVSALTAGLRKSLKGSPLPAPRATLAAAVEGLQVDFDTASLIETRYIVSLTTGQIAKNMMHGNFFDLQKIKAGASRPADQPNHRVGSVGVLGAGLMGAGIAYVCARAGIDVTLVDISLEAAEKGKAYSAKGEARAVKRGETTDELSEALLERITPTADITDLATVDLVVEAVFENPELKGQVLKELAGVVQPTTLIASNTSTLPITQLAHAVDRPEDFVGVHFFSPVDRMALIEVVRGQRTSDAAVAKAFDFARQIGKTPIVVKDSRGFFTSRVFLRFLEEAVALVGDGVDPNTVEQAGLQAGYPAAPLQLIDDTTLTLPRQIQLENRSAAEAAGRPWQDHRSAAVLDTMIDGHGRKGRSSGAGFYDYEDGKRLLLWSGLRDVFASGRTAIPFVDLQERMLFTEALESVRCLDEGVVSTAADGNVGSLLGIGYPVWTGGVFQYINQYEGGLTGFVQRALELRQRYGDRFEPPASLVERASRGEVFD